MADTVWTVIVAFHPRVRMAFGQRTKVHAFYRNFDTLPEANIIHTREHKVFANDRQVKVSLVRGAPEMYPPLKYARPQKYGHWAGEVWYSRDKLIDQRKREADKRFEAHRAAIKARQEEAHARNDG